MEGSLFFFSFFPPWSLSPSLIHLWLSPRVTKQKNICPPNTMGLKKDGPKGFRDHQPAWEKIQWILWICVIKPPVFSCALWSHLDVSGGIVPIGWEDKRMRRVWVNLHFTHRQRKEKLEWREPWLFVCCYNEEASLHVAVIVLKFAMHAFRIHLQSKTKGGEKKNKDRKNTSTGDSRRSFSLKVAEKK